MTETFFVDHDNNSATATQPKTTVYDWVYDDVGRLLSEKVDSFENSLDRTETFTMDLFGNRVKKTIDIGNNSTIDELISSVYDTSDRIQSESRDVGNNGSVEQTTTYTWNGTQQASKTVTAYQSDPLTSQSMTYNLQGRLTSVTTEKKNSSNVVTERSRVEYRYDSAGMRVAAIESTDGVLSTTTFEAVAGNTTEYLVDHSNFTGYAQTIVETTKNASGQRTKRIAYNFGNDELSQTVTVYDPATGAITSTTTQTFGHDAHGSVRLLLSAAGAISQIYTYLAYGEMLSIHSSNGSLAAQSQTNLLYSGESFDSRIGQQYLRARWYDPRSARFDRLDPFSGSASEPHSFNKYLYVHGDPIRGTDPTGLSPLSGLLASIGIMSGQRSGESINAGGTLHVANSFQKLVKIYQKALQVWDRVTDIYDKVHEILDLLDLGSEVVDHVRTALTGKGINGLLNHLPIGVIEAEINIPERMMNRFNKLASIAYKVLSHNKVQEFLGEVGTALFINVIGFEQSPELQLDRNNGPDQIASHSRTGVFGIFEAKGGKSKLSQTMTSYGKQMDNRWITHWIETTYANNINNDAGRALRNAHVNNKTMIASVSRLNINHASEFKVAVQRYAPPNGSHMDSWGPDW